jgi:cullin-4
MYLIPELARSISDMTTNIFRETIFPSSRHAKGETPSLGARMVHDTCKLVALDRTANPDFDSALLHATIDMMHTLQVYHHFEDIFVAQSKLFYQEFAVRASERPLKDYIRACQLLTTNEDARCATYRLDSTTARHMSQAMQARLVREYSQKLLDGGGVSRLIADNEVQSLRDLMRMLRDASLHDKLMDPWQDHITRTGKQIVGSNKGDKLIIELITFKHRLEAMARVAFKGHGEFASAIRSKLHTLLQAQAQPKGRASVGEMVAKYMDMLLRGGYRTLPADMLRNTASEDRRISSSDGAAGADPDAELNRQLDYALDLFSLVDGIDAFEGFYKRDLSRRLLMGRSASMDAERATVAKLKGTCGPEYTGNLDRMFKDLDGVAEPMKAFREYCAERKVLLSKPAVEFDVRVLSMASWPSYPLLKVSLPPDVASRIEMFEAHYKKAHSGRSLKWPLGLATCVVKAEFDQGTKDLCVSAAQASVLLAFNQLEEGGKRDSGGQKNFLTYRQLQQATALDDPELQRTLISLACAKTRVLTKNPRSNTVVPSDTFCVNKAFTHPSQRVKIHQVSLRDNAGGGSGGSGGGGAASAETTETRERVKVDRGLEVQAVLVRIMKACQTVTHAELMDKAITSLQRRGAVVPAEVKTEIDRSV